MTTLLNIDDSRAFGGLSIGCSADTGKSELTLVDLVRESLRGNVASSAHWRCQASAAHTAGDVALIVFAQESAVRFDTWAKEDSVTLARLTGGAR